MDPLMITGAIAIALAAVLVTMLVTSAIRRMDQKKELKATEERILKYVNQQKALMQKLEGMDRRINELVKKLAKETQERMSTMSRFDTDLDTIADQFPLIEDFRALEERVKDLERDPKAAYVRNGTR